VNAFIKFKLKMLLHTFRQKYSKSDWIVWFDISNTCSLIDKINRPRNCLTCRLKSHAQLYLSLNQITCGIQHFWGFSGGLRWGFGDQDGAPLQKGLNGSPFLRICMLALRQKCVTHFEARIWIRRNVFCVPRWVASGGYVFGATPAKKGISPDASF